jgi:predicted nucleic acid-binding protein
MKVNDIQLAATAICANDVIVTVNTADNPQQHGLGSMILQGV